MSLCAAAVKATNFSKSLRQRKEDLELTIFGHSEQVVNNLQ